MGRNPVWEKGNHTKGLLYGPENIKRINQEAQGRPLDLGAAKQAPYLPARDFNGKFMPKYGNFSRKKKRKPKEK